MRASAFILRAVTSLLLLSLVRGQRIQTVELADSRYFISNASPYSPSLNWFLAYEYCHTIGMELLSFQGIEETEVINSYLSDNGYSNSEYWTSGNQLGSEMWIWMSTGQPFNNTFNFWAAGGPPLTKSQQSCMSHQKGTWSPQNCMDPKHFICEQTRCFYYNYVTTNRRSSQGNSTTAGITGSPASPSLRPVRPLRRPSIPTPASVLQGDPQTQPADTHNPPAINETLLNDDQLTSTPIAKLMSTTISPEADIKVMPTEAPPQQDPKEMPVTSPPKATASEPIVIANNEILPASVNSEFLLLQPPTKDFDAGATEETSTANVRLLSRQETFSWALKDSSSP
ncbi:uncharacterized protein LOC134762980 isoform X1 [Penaeus indicus]|uniref:uncharacterized protein LOC134762980 isoform X1 n=2 Tax=Penaeus indicus TaxID=29960 RepID=UPI00300DBC53